MPSISARMLLISASLPVMSVLIPPISALMLCIAVPMRLVSAQTPLGSVPMHAIATLMVMRLVMSWYRDHVHIMSIGHIHGFLLFELHTSFCIYSCQ